MEELEEESNNNQAQEDSQVLEETHQDKLVLDSQALEEVHRGIIDVET
jgi:hypothetical protein